MFDQSAVPDMSSSEKNFIGNFTHNLFAYTTDLIGCGYLLVLWTYGYFVHTPFYTVDQGSFLRRQAIVFYYSNNWTYWPTCRCFCDHTASYKSNSETKHVELIKQSVHGPYTYTVSQTHNVSCITYINVRSQLHQAA